MSSLSYNPNIDIPPYHNQMPRYDTSQQMMPSMLSYSNNVMPQSNMMQVMPQPQMMQSYGMQQPQMMPMMQQQPQMMPPMYPMPTTNKKQKKADQFTNVEEKPNNIGKYIKKLIIFTILFLVISHVKTNDLIEKIPMVKSNEIFMMVVKGVIMAIIIIIIDRILG